MNAPSPTPAQLSYVASLADQAGPERYATVLATLNATTIDTLTRRQMSSLIPALKEAAAAQRATTTANRQRTTTAPAPITSGMYLHNDTAFRVYQANNGNYLLVKALVDGDWEYRGTPKRCGLTAEMRMTLDQAKQYGKSTGVCVCCGRTLTNPDSIELGIGPICRSKNFG